MKAKLLLLLLFIASILRAEDHKIIYLVSSPRSLSTVFLCMMDHRGDFAVFNEPAMLAYKKSIQGKLDRSFIHNRYREEAFQTFGEVKTKVFQELEYKNVFIKEVSFGIHEILTNDANFIKNPNVHFVFLIRDPHEIALSFYKKDPISTKVIEELVGVKELYNLFCHVNGRSPNPVKIFFSDQLSENPEETVKAFCNHFSLPFEKGQLHWDAYDEEFTGVQEWNEIKEPENLHLWHGEAIKSTCFRQPGKYEVDERGEPTFSEIREVEDREKYRKVYWDHLPYYQQFLALKEFHLCPVENLVAQNDLLK